ncbi:MAG: response regulator [Chloroflexi bacterium]|nr:response regulator [Chloroflexota bacterium]
MSDKKHNILIVDDEPRVAFFFQQHLELLDEGYVVTAVNSGQEALKLLQEGQKFDLLITDLRMPGMDGLELLSKVSQMAPATRTILVTAYGGADVWAEAERLRTFKALSKPLKIADLIAAVREALTQNRQKKSGIIALTGEVYKLLTGSLENLRLNLGGRATILADTDGHVLVQTGSTGGLELSTMMSLLGGTVAASNALAQQLHYPKPHYLTYFEGPPFDLLATNIGEQFLLTLILERRKETGSRLGLVWLYTQRTLKELEVLLGRDLSTASPMMGNNFAATVQSELDDLFGETTPPVVAEPAAPRPKTAQPTAVTTSAPPVLMNKVANMLHKFGLQTKLSIEHRLDDLGQVPNGMAATLIVKIVAEGLKNVYQHAQATIVGLSFLYDDEAGRIHGRLADDGVGFNMNHPPTYHALEKLRAECTALGGLLEISAYPAQGTNLIFELPLRTSH